MQFAECILTLRVVFVMGRAVSAKDGGQPGVCGTPACGAGVWGTALLRCFQHPGRLRPLGMALLVAGAVGGSAARAETSRVERWIGAVAEAREVIAVCGSSAPDRSVSSATLRLGDAGVPLTLDVREVEYLWLVVDPTEDGFGCDHAAWGEPCLSLVDGRTLDLTHLKPLTWQVGWFDLQVDRNSAGSAISIGGKPYSPALFSHSPAVVCYALRGRFTTFSTVVGIDDASCGGSASFEVHTRLPVAVMAATFWERLKARYPEQTAWIEEDRPEGRHLDWLAAADGDAGDVHLVRQTLDGMGQGGTRLAAEWAAMQNSGAGIGLVPCLELYSRARLQVARYRHVQDRLTFVRKTLEFVEAESPQPLFHLAIQDLATRIAAARDDPDADYAPLLEAARALRREIIFTHPALQFDTLLINKRPPPTYSHQCDQYLGRHSRPGPGLVLLRHWRGPAITEQRLLPADMPKGSVLHPDLSFDAERVVFSFCDHGVEPASWRRYMIYDIGIDGQGLRQLTGTVQDALHTPDDRRTVLIEDFDPCYLPDGGIAFVSTRCQSMGRCHATRYNPSYLLHRMAGDGRDLRQLSFGEANEWDPSVLPDGRLIYTRWDYINRHDVLFQSLWALHPDGTANAHFYGNATVNPCMTAEARAIPGGASGVVATAMAHHAYTSGSIIAIDPRRGQNGLESLTRITPEVPFPETEGWDMKGCFATPWPLSNDLFLAACCLDEPLAMQGQVQSENAFAIVLVDTLGGREVVYRDPEVSCFAPIPVVPRPRPPILPSIRDLGVEDNTGVFYVRDAGLLGEGVHLDVAALRVNAIIGQPTAAVPHRGKVRQEIVKRIVGTVPVNADGSVSFRAPAGVPLQLQALDDNGMALMTMRSFVFLQPGETSGCIGCHEPRQQAPTRYPVTAPITIRPLDPPGGPRYDGGFNYRKTVQPVLDRYCITCHGLEHHEADLNLLGTSAVLPINEYPGWPATLTAPESYIQLVERPGLVALAQRNEETPASRPKDYFAHAGRLASHLLAGHCKPLLADRESLSCLIDWLDLNGQCYGDYSWNRPGDRPTDPAGEKALREAIGARFGSSWAGQPLAALVNTAMPSQSRILLAPLARDAGGWGQIETQPFTSTDSPDYRAFRGLVDASIAPSAGHDMQGTCGQDPCRCGCCWVRKGMVSKP